MDWKKENWLDVITYENSILENTIDQIPPQHLPHGYVEAFKSGKDAYKYHRHLYIQHVLKYKESSVMTIELEKLEQDIRKLDISNGNVLRRYLQNDKTLNRIVPRMNNVFLTFNEIKSNSQEKIELTLSMLNFYVLKYEVLEYLLFFSLVVQMLKGQSIDIGFERFKDQQHKIKLGIVVDYISNGLKGYPMIKTYFDKAYSPKLRNSIGHNNYVIKKSKFKELDSDFELSEKEFIEIIYHIQEMQSAIFNMMCLHTIDEKKVSDCGVIGVKYDIDTFNTPIVTLFQLWTFFGIDDEHLWLRRAEVKANKKNIAIKINGRVTFKGEWLPEISNWYREASSLKKIRVIILPIGPLEDENEIKIDTGGKTYQIMGSSYMVSIPIKFNRNVSVDL